MTRRPKKPTTFVFESYSIDRKANTISFLYSFDNGQKFIEKILLGPGVVWKKSDRVLIDKIVFNLHLALGIGYYKAYCPRKIIIRSGSLSKAEAAFWNKLYTKGLGEFFYRNKINFRGLVDFPHRNKKAAKPIRIRLADRSLLPWGGGKDSSLAAEILKELGHNFSLISLRDSAIQKETAKVVGRDRIVVGREIDPGLIELNRRGAYNGHIPISAIYSWITVLAAALKGYRHIVFANEASANYGNVRYLGTEINHQYSKSLEFENDFRAYLRDFITPDINYFSLLRRFSELKISQLFSSYKKYLPAFSSCNRNFSLTKTAEKRWCGECPKCLFAFSQLAAFLGREQMIKIFGHDLLAKGEALPVFQELWGEKKFKPFDCVGTPTEVEAAFLLISAKKEWLSSPIVKYFRRHVAPRIKDPGRLLNEALKSQPGDNVPLNFKKILILGYGLEGKFAYRYLRKKYPHLRFGVADRKPIDLKDERVMIFSGLGYLEAVSRYEVIIKSPGISDQEPELTAAKNSGREISSITNLFLENCREQTIGVTGTKGKSTTASLIFQIMKAAGRKAYLVGNIGHDPLQYLAGDGEDRIFIYELSSYQLATATRSPRVSVFINIFPDHLPYHRGFANYFAAKANITNFQTEDDSFVFNSEYPRLRALAQKTNARKIDYLKRCSVRQGNLYYGAEKIMPLSEIKLLGTHNLKNIMAAVCTAKIYGIDNRHIRQALKKFTNLEHRLQFVGRHKGISFYDDAISTTPESTLAAIDVFQKDIGTIILGGEDRGYDFSVLAERLAGLAIPNFVFFPDSGRKIAGAIRSAYRRKKLPLPKGLSTRSMAEAVKFAYRQIAPGKICLLSTASPSYSLFRNFQEKGDRFQQAIKKYRK